MFRLVVSYKCLLRCWLTLTDHEIKAMGKGNVRQRLGRAHTVSVHS